MSNLTNKGKLISRFEIGFDNETKADIDALKAKIDELTRALSVKNDSHGDRLLAARQAEAANDAPVTYSPWENDLKRATVNDVDYLSGSDLDECVPHIDNVSDQPNWLSESVPQITQADMQLIFIKNLSEVLIQRMHSMNRFSEDDYAIGGDKLMAWDIVANPKGDFAVITGHNQDKRYFGGLYFVPYARGNHAKTVSGERANEYLKTLEFCTITEDQLPAFRAALEACYA